MPCHKSERGAQRLDGRDQARFHRTEHDFSWFFVRLRPCQKRPLHLVSAPSSPPWHRPLRASQGAARQDAVVAQLVRAPVCGTGGRWFEPTQLYQRFRSLLRSVVLLYQDILRRSTLHAPSALSIRDSVRDRDEMTLSRRRNRSSYVRMSIMLAYLRLITSRSNN